MIMVIFVSKMSSALLFQELEVEDEVVNNGPVRAVHHRTPRHEVPDPFVCLSEDAFIKRYRLTKALSQDLIAELSPHIRQEKRSDGLDVKTKVLVAISFLASGSYQTLVGDNKYHQVSQPSVSRAVQQVTDALNLVFRSHVNFPMSRESREEIKLRFYQKFRIPGIVGCIDGTHVAIIKPILNEERYFNRKGYHSLNTMIICDSNLNILCVDPSSPGATHDSTVWRDHPLKQYLEATYEQGEPLCLLGDSGYPLRRTMMTPILNAEPNTPAAYYYQAQVSARNIVERCIGVLKARFRCLLAARELHYNPVTAAQMVNACSVLHNIANRARLPVPELTNNEIDEERRLQIHLRVTEHEMRTESITNYDIQANIRRRQANTELMQGRAAQDALVQRLWAQHRN